MIDRSYVLQRLENASNNGPDEALVPRIKAWLQHKDTRLVSSRPSKVSVSEALRLWTTRLKNTDVTGQRLDGVDSLLEQLKGLTPQRKLEQYALVGSKTTGNLFFEGSSLRFVGAVLVDTKKSKK
jgi:hypothetical protein